jgi:hypothetical protein
MKCFMLCMFITLIITGTFLAKLDVEESNFGSYKMNGVMEDAQGYYIHEEEIKGMHVSIRNVEIGLNGRRDRKDPITMRILHKEMQSYRDDNERIMKDQGEIHQSLNIGSHGGNSKNISKRNMCLSIIMKGR